MAFIEALLTSDVLISLLQSDSQSKFARVDNSIAIGSNSRQHKHIATSFLPIIGDRGIHDAGEISITFNSSLLVCSFSVGMEYFRANRQLKISDDLLELDEIRKETCEILDPLVAVAVSQLGIAHFTLEYSLFRYEDILQRPEEVLVYREY